MRVEPGDRRIVAVRPMATVGLAPQDCDRCGVRLEPPEAYELAVREVDIDLALVQVVCGTCAEALRPIRILVDLDRIADASEEHAPLQQLLARIRAARQRPLPRRILLRASDTDELAHAYGVDRAELVDRLSGSGLVALAA